MADVGSEIVFLSSRHWRQMSRVRLHREPSQALCGPRLSRATLSTSYVNGVVAFVAHLFPASRASVSILQGITEALATEDVATFCRNNETPVLHNLRVPVHADGAADGARGPEACGCAPGGVGGHVHVLVPGQLLLITAHHTAIRVVLAQPPAVPPRPPPL